MKKIITEEIICGIRASLNEKISPKRLNHILEVEKMAARLGELYLPEKIDLLRVAALLHDITKELSIEEHKAIFAAYSIDVPKEELLAPKTLHAISAAAIIVQEYPDFADAEIVSCVRWHTTGHSGMTILEKLIFLADYIDMSRDFEDCIRAREYFFAFDFDKADNLSKEIHLNKTLIMCLDMTIKEILERGSVISEETFKARNDLICRIEDLKKINT